MTDLSSLSIRQGHHTVSLERIEAGELLASLNGVAPGTPFFRLSLNGKMQLFRPDAKSVRAAFRKLCRRVGIAPARSSHPFIFCNEEAQS